MKDRYITSVNDRILETLFDKIEKLHEDLHKSILINERDIKEINEYAQTILELLNENPRYFDPLLNSDQTRVKLPQFNSYIMTINERDNIPLSLANDLNIILKILNREH